MDLWAETTPCLKGVLFQPGCTSGGTHNHFLLYAINDVVRGSKDYLFTGVDKLNDMFNRILKGETADDQPDCTNGVGCDFPHETL